MITFKELDEAHKIGDKVTFTKGSEKGKEGRIGEIRKGLYKGAEKTYTVDYDHNETTGQAKSVQVKAKHIQKVKESVDLQEKHRVAITVSDPKHPMVSKRKELIQKIVRIAADNQGHAVDSAIAHYRKAGYKVHDHHYIGTVKEEVELDEVRSEYSKAAHDEDGKALGIRPGSKPEHNPVVKHHVIHSQGKHYISVEHKSGMSYSHKDSNGNTQRFDSKEDAEKKAHELNKKHGISESALDKFRAASAEREKEAKKREDEMKARHAQGKEDMSGAIDTLAKRLNKEEVEQIKEGSSADAAAATKDVAKANLATKQAKEKEALALKQEKEREALTKEEVELEEARGFSKPKGFVEIDKNEYNTHLTNRQEHEKKGIINHREVYTKHNVAGKITHSIEHHAGGQVNHGIPEIAKSVDYEKQQVKYYKQDKKANEDVAVNNVGGGSIAGTQGDAGKKSVMTKKPLKRKLMTFKEACDCWKGYKRKPGTKPCAKGSCVKENDELEEAAIDAKGHKSSTGGLTQKGVDAYNRENPGHHLQTAVTTPPSKLDPNSKAAKRRKSFCARMSGVDGPMKDEKGRPTRKALALRKWNC